MRRLFWVLMFAITADACTAPQQAPPGYVYRTTFSLAVQGGVSPLSGISGGVTPSWTNELVPIAASGAVKP